MAAEDLDHEVIDLLQGLIRNQCVNDGTKESGHEIRSVELLESFLDGHGLDLERYEPVPGRASLLASIHGSGSSAPTLMLMGHTDVVAANRAGWRHDPFGGVSNLQSSEASVSSIDTPLWQAVTRATTALIPGAATILFLLVGFSDARYFRRMGTVAYGAGLFNPTTSFLELAR